ncbi:MAG: cation diffusion facilitator family transporter [Pirellulales bacterium]
MPSEASKAQTEAAFRRVAQDAQFGARAVLAGVVANILLAAVKILAGMIGNAYALIADGVESMLDIFGSVVAWGSLKASAALPSERFPFGYGRFEPLGALVVALGLLVVAAGIAFASIREIITPHHLPAPFTLVVLVAVVITKELLFRRMLRTGEAIGSTVVGADAWHHRSDAITSLAAFVGISIAVVGGPGYESADDWAALLACTVIAANGVRILRTAMAGILDVAPPLEFEQQVRSIAGQVDGVVGLDKCRIRKSGLGYFVDLHVVVAAEMSVRRGHEISHGVKNALLGAGLGILDAVIHIEPDVA